MRRALFALPFVFAAVSAQAKESAVERTKGLVEAFKAVKVAPAGQALSAADQKQNQAAFSKLDGYFNYTRVAGDPLEPHKAKFTPEQYQKAQKMFEELIRLVSYPQAGNFLREATFQIKPGKTPSEAAMHATLAKEDFETDVVFHWQEQGGALRLVDVSFDGASLIKDYKNQFGRILEKEGPDGFLKKLSTRLEKERKAQGA